MTVDDPGTLRIAPDTHLVRFVVRDDALPMAVHSNTLVVAGVEPLLVDLGLSATRERWLDRVGSVVDLPDVRWVFVSHDDADHTGNLDAVLEHCPRAVVVSSWLGGMRRLGTSVEVPAHRQRWVRDGEAFDAGDRTLVAVRPPVFDAADTRGLLDTATGVQWTADAFGTALLPCSDVVDHVGELDAGCWAEGFVAHASWHVPWHDLVSPERWRAEIERFRTTSPTAIASAHGPLIRGTHVDAAIGLLSGLVKRSPVPTPGQEVLDRLTTIGG